MRAQSRQTRSVRSRPTRSLKTDTGSRTETYMPIRTASKDTRTRGEKILTEPRAPRARAETSTRLPAEVAAMTSVPPSVSGWSRQIRPFLR